MPSSKAHVIDYVESAISEDFEGIDTLTLGFGMTCLQNLKRIYGQVEAKWGIQNSD